MMRIGLAQARLFAQVYLQTMDAEQAAAAIGAKDGAALLAEPLISEELDKRRQLLAAQLAQRDVLRSMAQLAFGRCNDCVKLVLEQEPQVDKLDLRLLSEVKRNEKGTVEVKLLNRLQVLEQLQLLLGGGSAEAEAFLSAMNAAVDDE